MSKTAKPIRCAIYTRVSTEYGLEQDFNSLDAQREAAEAYIKSQTHEGWKLQPGRFDDGGFSGGTLERPALRKLLQAIRQRKIDVVVVYKVDRLTRSLADFAKLVELFDAHDVSFVSVTQAFNTTTSMGRLTLNVLLSFAQFEREVTGERIRDKIAASKRKGMRMGGLPPLGYDVFEKKLVPNAEEAERVRNIFRAYCNLKSLTKTLVDLRQRNIVTKKSTMKGGRIRGGIHFNKNGLVHLLKNRAYRGEVVHKGEYFPGEHPAIVDAELFDAAQEALASRHFERASARLSKAYLLTGKLFDRAGHRMAPATARKGGMHYRYYVSTAGANGHGGKKPSRASATELEAAVVDAVTAGDISTQQNSTGQIGRIAKVVVEEKRLEVSLAAAGRKRARTIRVAWTPSSVTRRREIILPNGDGESDRPIRWENRARLVEGIAKARRWLDELTSGKVLSTEAIAAREKLSERSVRMSLNLAFLSPQIVAAVISGEAPWSYGLVQLSAAPVKWSAQIAGTTTNAIRSS